MIDLIVSRTGVFFGLMGSLLIFVSFFIYAFNKRKYEFYISLFLKSHQFPAPYSVYYLMGFFGAYQTCRFFIKICKKERVNHFHYSDSAYSFFSENRITIDSWMMQISRLWKLAGICYLLMGISIMTVYLIR